MQGRWWLRATMIAPTTTATASTITATAKNFILQV